MNIKKIASEKLKHENKIIKNIKCTCKSLFQYVKSKTKIYKKH